MKGMRGKSGTQGKKNKRIEHLNLVLSHSLVEETQNFQTLEIQICPDKFLHFSRC